MSHRDRAERRNGIIALVRRTIAYADTARGRAFFGHAEQEMNAEVRKVETAYTSHRGYAGPRLLPV